MNMSVITASVAIPSLPLFTVGPDAYAGVAEVMRPFGVRALLIGGQKALAAALRPLQEAVAEKGIILVISLFSGECTWNKAMEMADTARGIKADVVLGMGGGRALDTAKAAAHYAGLPVITLPTIAATCAAVTALCVMHHAENSLSDPFLFLNAPPAHAFLHTGILAASPAMYLRAGIGDSLAKYAESAFKAEKGELSCADRQGLSIARSVYESLLSVGIAALNDAKAGRDSVAFRLACQCCIVSTGQVSLLVKESLNGALAHSLFYALRDHPALSSFLHGDLVAWGCLVQLALEGKAKEACILSEFLREISIPVSLHEMGVPFPDPTLTALLPGVLRQPDMAGLPCRVSEASLLEAILETENLRKIPYKEG